MAESFQPDEGKLLVLAPFQLVGQGRAWHGYNADDSSRDEWELTDEDQHWCFTRKRNGTIYEFRMLARTEKAEDVWQAIR